MQNFLKIFVVFWAALSLTGCDAPSLHPFFTDEDIVLNEALLGVWVSEPGEKCIITRSGDKHYELLYFDDAPARFEARLFELGGATFHGHPDDVMDLGHLIDSHESVHFRKQFRQFVAE